MTRFILTLDRWVTQTAMAIASASLGGAVLVAFYQVVARFVLEQPSTWSEVLTRFLLHWMVFLGLTGAFRAGALVSVDLCWRLSRGRFRQILDLFITGVSLALMAGLVWYGIAIVERIRFQTLAGLDISIAFAYAAIPVGAGLAVIGILAHHVDPRRLELDMAT